MLNERENLGLDKPEITEDMFDFKDKVAELEEYYECAGYADFYERVLKPMSEEEIAVYFHNTFFKDNDPETVRWRRDYFTGMN